jgi:hypothetical protein
MSAKEVMVEGKPFVLIDDNKIQNWQRLAWERPDTMPVFLNPLDDNLLGIIWRGEIHAIAVGARDGVGILYLAVSRELLEHARPRKR